jgi:DNA-binding MarR family transcriptional regulator
VVAVESERPLDPILAAADNWRKHGWDRPTLTATLSIVRVEEIIRELNATVLRPHHLTHVRHEALAVLYFSRNGEMPLGKLSKHLLLHPTSVTSTVDTLERLGLAERVAHPTDRRATLARITPKGRRVIEQSCEKITENPALDALTEAELKALFSILAKVRAAAGDIPLPNSNGRHPSTPAKGAKQRPPSRRLQAATKSAE